MPLVKLKDNRLEVEGDGAHVIDKWLLYLYQ